jgi:type I restriction-modification system DNA methylase subunit
MAKPEDRERDRQAAVLNVLSNLKGLDPLKELFWQELNYERVNEPISRQGWAETASKALADDPLVFAGGGENNDFKIIVARLDSDHVRLGLQRPVINRLLRDFPYGLFVFSNRDRNAWHFVNVKYDDDPKRRQLFRRISVAPGDRLRTASERMAMFDLESIGAQAPPLAVQDRHDEAFDVEKVTKKFFDDFVEIFAAVAKDIRKHNDWEQDVVEKETQTLLNRLLFLYFIQRKGWLNRERDYLYKRFKEHLRDDKDGFTYYSRFLFPLFMRLSTEMEEPASFLGDVPFLNGGLFDDEYGAQQRHDKLLRRTRMKVSNRAFARVFDDVLERYNFTVREDTPLNQDVSIDPEMLGKIFESLVLQLEQSDTGGKTSRHDTGSYYTPRPIVHYLCREALRVCLESKGEDRHRNIAKLLTIDASDGIDADERAVLDECLSPEQAKALRDDLDNLRACDPAVGSGAFPLGLLHELVNLSRLCEARSRGRDPVEVDVDWLYNTKSRFIERVIYGVDIQERAVEICKLRLWLSLMVDLDIGVDVDDCSASAFRSALKRKVTPLPNLEYKIRRADSLIDRIHGEQVNFANIDPSDKTLPPILNRLTSAKREFYTAHKLKDKRRIQFEILDAIAHLAMIEFQRAKLSHGFGFVLTKSDEEAAARQAELQRAESYMAKVRKEIAFARKGTGALQDNTLERLTKEIDSAEKPTFVWQLDFAEVFHRRSNPPPNRDLISSDDAEALREIDGFDIIVANPPYVRQEKLKQFKSAFQQAYRCYTSAADLFVYFYERGLQLLRANGVLSFISSNKFFRAGYGENLRKFLGERTKLRTVIDFGDLPIFEATVYPCIVIAQRTAPTKDVTVQTLNIRSTDELERFTELAATHTVPLPQNELRQEGWRLESPTILRVLEKLRAAGKPLAAYLGGKIYRGIVTGFNEAFVIDEATRNRLIKSDPNSRDLIKFCTEGKHLKRWRSEPSSYIIIVTDAIVLSKYPAIERWLSDFKDVLEDRWDKGKKWFSLRPCAYYGVFEKPKIVWPNLGTATRFAFDSAGSYLCAPTCCMDCSELWLLGVLNSVTTNFHLRRIAAGRAGGFYEAKPMYEIQQLFRPWLFQAPAGSYQFAVRLESPEQLELGYEARHIPAVEEVTGKFVEILNSAATDPDEALASAVPNPEYRSAFLKLARNLAPSGKTYAELEIRSQLRPEVGSVVFSADDRKIINQTIKKSMPAVESTEGADVTLTGILRAVHLDQDWIEVTVREPAEEHIKIEGAGEAIDDVVGPMMNRPVQVDATRTATGRLLFKDIQPIE